MPQEIRCREIDNMTAETLLEQVSEKHDLGWNDSTMLTHACGYIDNQMDPGAFEDYLEQVAAEEVAGIAEAEEG